MCFPSFSFAEIHPFVALMNAIACAMRPRAPQSPFVKSDAKAFKAGAVRTLWRHLCLGGVLEKNGNAFQKNTTGFGIQCAPDLYKLQLFRRQLG